MVRFGLVVPLVVALGCSGAAGGEDWTSPDEGGTSAGATGGTGGSRGGTSARGGGSGTSGSGGAAPAGGGQSSAGANAGRSGAGAQGGSGGSGGTTGTAGLASGSHTNPLSADLINAFVAAHNAARASSALDPAPSPPLPPVSWDPILADSAYNYLSQCVASDGQLVDHNDNRSSDYQALGGPDRYVGENIYATTGNTIDPADAVDSWMSEAKDYDYQKNDFAAAGHYTQVVWRESVKIGCAIVNCPGVHFNDTVLCDYAPGGNLAGQKPY